MDKWSLFTHVNKQLQYSNFTAISYNCYVDSVTLIWMCSCVGNLFPNATMLKVRIFKRCQEWVNAIITGASSWQKDELSPPSLLLFRSLSLAHWIFLPSAFYHWIMPSPNVAFQPWTSHSLELWVKYISVHHKLPSLL